MSKRDPKPDAAPPAEAQVTLSLEDTVAQKLRGIPVKTRTGVVGYNPYDAVPAAKAKAKDAEVPHKPTDLRKLSQWIRLKREVAEMNAETPKKKT